MHSRSKSSVRCRRCRQEGDWRTFMRCSRCKVAIYCSNECQMSDWPYHKLTCESALPPQHVLLLARSHKVIGVTLACNADRARGARVFETKVIDASHPIHTQGVPCPLFQQVGFPLVLFRHHHEDPASMIRDPGLDNQLAAHLMTHPNTGHPEPMWRRAGCIGTVTVMRQDGKSFSFEAMETALMYVDHILNKFRDGESPVRLMNPAGFQLFCETYKEEMISGGSTTFTKMNIPL